MEVEAPFSLEEIYGVVKECISFKTPGPDGFNMLFVKKSWISKQMYCVSFWNFIRTVRLLRALIPPSLLPFQRLKVQLLSKISDLEAWWDDCINYYLKCSLIDSKKFCTLW